MRASIPRLAEKNRTVLGPHPIFRKWALSKEKQGVGQEVWNRRTRVRELINRGVPKYWAERVGTSRKGPWRLSRNTTVAKALPVVYFTRTLGLVLPG
jgi:hypothetical protein